MSAVDNSYVTLIFFCLVLEHKFSMLCTVSTKSHMDGDCLCFTTTIYLAIKIMWKEK